MRALWSSEEDDEVDEIPEAIPVLEVAPENLDPELELVNLEPEAEDEEEVATEALAG